MGFFSTNLLVYPYFMKLSSVVFSLLIAGSFYTKAQPAVTGPSVGKADSLLALSDWNAASLAYKTVLQRDPDNSSALSNLGFCYHQLQQYSAASEKYTSALSKTKDPALEKIILVRQARSFSRLKEYDNAFKSINSALDLGYAKAGELEKENDFEALRKDNRFTKVVARATENAFPCMQQKQLREFDFWIGEWTAYITGTEQVAGFSRIDLASGGCMILENWTSAGNMPFAGKSINFIDDGTGKWKQIWIGSNAPSISEFVNGSYRDGAMRFEFEQNTPQGNKQLVHFIFYNEGVDQVRQHHKTSTDDGKTWNTTYDFTYKRKKV